ncbi:hypothetical protein OH77DRAFT_275006 [Trametes cingulata]|nr:hypothetical protein OH77DRAFT_275006 [Trametes cingulata]
MAVSVTVTVRLDVLTPCVSGYYLRLSDQGGLGREDEDEDDGRDRAQRNARESLSELWCRRVLVQPAKLLPLQLRTIQQVSGRTAGPPGCGRGWRGGVGAVWKDLGAWEGAVCELVWGVAKCGWRGVFVGGRSHGSSIDGRRPGTAGWAWLGADKAGGARGSGRGGD